MGRHHLFFFRESEEKGPLNWPKGNGLESPAPPRKTRRAKNIRTSQVGAPHHAEPPRRKGLRRRKRVQAEFVVFAAPTFLAPYLLEDFRAAAFCLLPWLTAISRSSLPRICGAEPFGTRLPDSPTLGYVDATHQSLRTHLTATSETFTGSRRRSTREKTARPPRKRCACGKKPILTTSNECPLRTSPVRIPHRHHAQGHAMIRPPSARFLRRAARRTH